MINKPINQMTELEKIINLIPRPCPIDFPEKLKPYWNSVQYMPTPIQCAWMLYYQDKN